MGKHEVRVEKENKKDTAFDTLFLLTLHVHYTLCTLHNAHRTCTNTASEASSY